MLQAISVAGFVYIVGILLTFAVLWAKRTQCPETRELEHALILVFSLAWPITLFMGIMGKNK